MLKKRFIAAAMLGTMLSGQAAVAQGSGPAEIPPASFAGNQYIDSRGCAFVRAGVSGNVVWVPRIGSDRRPICGLAPSSVAGAAVAAAPVPAPSAPATEATTTQATTTQATTTQATTTQATAASSPAASGSTTGPGAPMRTVATTTTPPRVATAPAAPAPAAAEPRRVTLAEICDGRTGPQPGIIDSRTGQPVDCGGASLPTVAQVAAPASAPAVPPAATAPAAPVDALPTRGPDAVMRIMTMAELCAESAATGVRFINRDTGQPVACPTAPSVAVAQAPAPAVSQPVPAAQVRVPAPSAETFPPLSREQMAATLADRPPPPRVADTFPPIALSQAAVQSPPAGYRPAFEDGRLNPERGLVQAASRPAVAGGHFVQVGTYGVPSNADRAAARMQALGFPVAFQTTRFNGQQVRVVAAGPFATRAEAQSALSAARNAGYRDAFIR